jgi:hypothetical protein
MKRIRIGKRVERIREHRGWTESESKGNEG